MCGVCEVLGLHVCVLAGGDWGWGLFGWVGLFSTTLVLNFEGRPYGYFRGGLWIWVGGGVLSLLASILRPVDAVSIDALFVGGVPSMTAEASGSMSEVAVD